MWGSNLSTTVEERAYRSLNMSIEENKRKRFKGEDKMIRALALANDEVTCLVTPRTTYSGEVEVEWNGNKESRIKGILSVDTGSASQHLQFPTSSDFYIALQSAASHGPVPIKLFCDYTSSMTDIAEAMRKGLDTKNTLLGHLFSNENSLYTSEGELPPNISEGNECQHKAYKTLREHSCSGPGLAWFRED